MAGINQLRIPIATDGIYSVAIEGQEVLCGVTALALKAGQVLVIRGENPITFSTSIYWDEVPAEATSSSEAAAGPP